MRAKSCLLILCLVVTISVVYIALNSTGEPNESLKKIVTQTHKHINQFQENLRIAEEKRLEIDPKYLAILGFTTNRPAVSQQDQQRTQQQQQQQPKDIQIEIRYLPSQSNSDRHSLSPSSLSPSETYSVVAERVTTTPYNGTKANFTIVTYVQDGQAPSAILLSQNIVNKFPNEYLLIYDLGLSEDENRALTAYCNNSKCSVITYDLSVFPSYVSVPRMHAYRPIVIKDALMRSKNILFTENNMRFNGSASDLYELRSKATSGVLGWTTPTAVSTRTHPKMFDYFQTDADDFFFLRMMSLDTVFFSDSALVTDKILLLWLKCTLTMDCIDPIGAQANGCKYNKKPLYRYSGCHAYDTSAFNIVLGLTWHLDESKYSMPGDGNTFFYKETLEQATKILENRRRNSSETSEHPISFTEE